LDQRQTFQKARVLLDNAADLDRHTSLLHHSRLGWAGLVNCRSGGFGLGSDPSEFVQASRRKMVVMSACIERLKKACRHKPNCWAQQRSYDPYREEYNWQRSHEALGRKTPGSVYRASPRPYPVKLPSIEYGSQFTVRQVRHNGEIKWRGERIYVSEVLAKEPPRA
jgi:hypothetical protein